MPRFNRVASTNNRYSTLFQSKTRTSRLNGDTDEAITFFAEETPLPTCVPLDYDCNWFLAVGGRKASVSGCQLGDSYRITRLNETIQFPGEVTYKFRPGVCSREGMTLYTDMNYVSPSDVEFASTSYLALNTLSIPPSTTYLETSTVNSTIVSTTYINQ